MFLDYSKLPFDKYGRPRKPELILKTLSEESICLLPGIHNLKFNIKFSEPSEITFDIPAKLDDAKDNPYYDEVCGYRIIYTKHYGVYLIMNPETESDGIEDVKHITGYSREKELEQKRFFLEEGTFKFYNILDQYDSDTVMGRILEKAVGWSVQYVSPTVASRYRTFNQYDDNLLSFMYNTAPEKFRCVFVFEPYGKTISVYDADEERPVLPIYLDFDNLVASVEVTEQSDELFTALSPHGADELDIRAVNPIGTNWLYDISHFISTGDVPQDLAQKWQTWQHTILNKQMYYRGLSSLQASATARQLIAQATLTDLQGELDSLVGQQSVTVQALAIETTDAGKQYQQNLLDTINSKIVAKNHEIDVQQAELTTIAGDLTAYGNCIQAVVDELAIQNYFTAEEYAVLAHYFIESYLTEETFVATDVDTSVFGPLYSLADATVKLSDSSIAMVDLSSQFSKTMYVLAGGTFSVAANKTLSGDMIRGTLEVANGGKCVLSMYTGKISVDGTTAPSGMVTVSGSLVNLTSDVSSVVADDIQTYEGTHLSFVCTSGDLYLTADISEYQKYSVQMELYDYAASVLSDISSPTYEFEIDSGNFLFAREFEPYRNSLELGDSIYLNLGHEQVIKPIVIEVAFEFEDWSKFSLIFSNRFKKRQDEVNALKDFIDETRAQTRSLDANKYIYGQAVNQATQVSSFMQSALDYAVNKIKSEANDTVVIDGTGIHIYKTYADANGYNHQCEVRMTDGMIAFTNDNWATSKLALGLFATENGQYFGIHAEVIGGKLIVGNNLVIENATDNGVMQFKVDSSGAWLNNSTFVLQKDNGGQILIDPRYGILAGTSIFTTNGTTVSPLILDNGGDVDWDNNTNAKFFLDLNTGDAYFRGVLQANSGNIGGWSIASDRLYHGSGSNYVALGGDSTNYAIWAGAAMPANAPFSVTKAGEIRATNGYFTGTIQGASFKDKSGKSMMVSDNEYKFDADYLSLLGIDVGNGNFTVDSGGHVSVRGNITMGAGSTINWANITESNASSSAAYQRANTAYSTASSAQTTANSAYDLADDAYTLAANNQLPGYIKSTYIDATQVSSPLIRANNFDVIVGDGASSGSYRIFPSSRQKTPAFAITWTSTRGAPRTSISMPWSGDMYIEATSIIVNGTNGVDLNNVHQLCGTEGCMYGTEEQKQRLSGMLPGQVFFVIS